MGSHVANKKLRNFCTHYLTTELAYVSTQQSGQFDIFLLNHFSVHCIFALNPLYEVVDLVDASHQFGPLTNEKCFENPHFIFVPPSKIFVWGE
jgi:hypothetical protein